MLKFRQWLQRSFAGAVISVAVLLVLASGSLGAQAAKIITTTGVVYVRGPISIAAGGTGISSYTIGDLIYASGTTTLSKLPDVATGSVLISGGVGVAPAWSTTPLATAFNVLSNRGIRSNGAVAELYNANSSGITAVNSDFFQFSNGASSSITVRVNAVPLLASTAPSSPASCGTSPAVTSSNGTAVFVVTGGTGGTATGCTITMPTATTGWVCSVVNITQTAAHRADRTTVLTASTTTSVTWEYQTVSTGAATAFTASDVFRGICFAY